MALSTELKLRPYLTPTEQVTCCLYFPFDNPIKRDKDGAKALVGAEVPLRARRAPMRNEADRWQKRCGRTEHGYVVVEARRAYDDFGG